MGPDAALCTLPTSCLSSSGEGWGSLPSSSCPGPHPRGGLSGGAGLEGAGLGPTRGGRSGEARSGRGPSVAPRAMAAARDLCGGGGGGE